MASSNLSHNKDTATVSGRGLRASITYTGEPDSVADFEEQESIRITENMA